MGAYSDAHRRSLQDPEGFWGEAAELLDWHRPPERVLDTTTRPTARWFVGGELNTAYNALDRHVEGGRADQVALIHDSPVTDSVRRLTFRELRDEVARFAGVLRGLGVQRGDPVIVYMPVIPEAAIAMLACARIGALHSVVFGGFAPPELASRVDDMRPKVVVAASCGIERSRIIEYKPLLDAALDLSSHRPERCVLLQRPQAVAELRPGADLDWDEEMAGAEPAEPVPVAATDPLYVLYTSGTTGHPKGVVHDNGGHAVALLWSVKNLYDVRPGEVFWAASDVGWAVGHSYTVYAPLLAGCTTIAYEGKPVGTPDAGAFWRVVQDHRPAVLFCAPTAFRAIKREDPEGALLSPYDVSSLRSLWLAGERLDPDTYEWARQLLGVPVIDHWWQTESGWPMAASPLGIEPLPVKPGSVSVAVPGYDIRVLGESGEERGAEEEGQIAVRQPLPPGFAPTLWKDEERFVDAYLALHPGYYTSGDVGYLDADGYVFVMGREDDVINVAGHRLSTGVMEEVLAEHPVVAECAVIGVQDDLKGHVPIGLVVLKAGEDPDREGLERELVGCVRASIGPVASFKRAIVVDRLPKTRSGKILRRTMRDIADGRSPMVPSTIEDPAVLDQLADALAATR